MSKTLRNMSLAFALMVVAAPMLSADVQAKDSFMKVCAAKFKSAKAAGTPEGNLKWTEFMKSQCAADATAAAPAPAPAATAAKATTKPIATTTTTPSGSFMQNCAASWKDMKAKNAVPAGMTWKAFVASKCAAPAAAATAPAAADATGGTFMQKCSAGWKAMKDAGTTPAGLTWKQYVSDKCVAAGVAATPVVVAKKPAAADTTMDPTPAEPDATNTSQEPLKTVDKNGKPFTPGQMAAHKRASECGAKWRANKPAFQAKYGTWPKYWSACNTEMKAAGQ